MRSIFFSGYLRLFKFLRLIVTELCIDVDISVLPLTNLTGVLILTYVTV